ncbi:hypothetical protein A0J61_11027, partial [Choanephora cucurbitarum]
MSEDITLRRSGRKRRANCNPDFEYEIHTSSTDRIEPVDENEENVDTAVEETLVERFRRQNRERQRGSRQRRNQTNTQLSEHQIQEARERNRENQRASRQRRRQADSQLSETQLEEVRRRNRESQRASRQRRSQREIIQNGADAFASIVQKYQNEIRKGPTVVCVCCGGLWFSDQTKSVTKESLLSRNASQEFIDNVFIFSQQQESDVFCFNCSLDVKKLRTPRLCASNGFEFPEIPEALSCLNRVEERLVLARHVFQSICTVLGLRGQYKSKGGIVNVPVSVDKTMSCVPRSLTDSNAIEVRLTRGLAQSNNYMAGNSAAYIKHNVKTRDSEDEYNQLSTLITQNHEFEQLVILFSEMSIDTDDTADEFDNDFMCNSNPGEQETMFA